MADAREILGGAHVGTTHRFGVSAQAMVHRRREKPFGRQLPTLDSQVPPPSPPDTGLHGAPSSLATGILGVGGGNTAREAPSPGKTSGSGLGRRRNRFSVLAEQSAGNFGVPPGKHGSSLPGATALLGETPLPVISTRSGLPASVGSEREGGVGGIHTSRLPIGLGTPPDRATATSKGGCKAPQRRAIVAAEAPVDVEGLLSRVRSLLERLHGSVADAWAVMEQTQGAAQGLTLGGLLRGLTDAGVDSKEATLFIQAVLDNSSAPFLEGAGTTTSSQGGGAIGAVRGDEIAGQSMPPTRQDFLRALTGGPGVQLPRSAFVEAAKRPPPWWAEGGFGADLFNVSRASGSVSHRNARTILEGPSAPGGRQRRAPR